MMERVRQERKFIEDAKVLLREEKVTMRVEQDRLNQRKDSWKERKKCLHADDTAGKLALKGAIKQLNERTMWLNNTIAQIKRTHEWIISRSKKLHAIELCVLNLTTNDSSSSAGVQREVDNPNLVSLRQLWKELETDLSLLGSEANMSSNNNNNIGPDSDEESIVHNILRTMIKGNALPLPLPLYNSMYENNNHNQIPMNSYIPMTSNSKGGMGMGMGMGMTTKWAIPTRMHNRNWDMPGNAMIEQGLVQSQLKRFAEQRVESTEAYEVHAKWLDNLQQEITRYTTGGQNGHSHGHGLGSGSGKRVHHENINMFNI
jgi:hypothetical protein